MFDMLIDARRKHYGMPPVSFMGPQQEWRYLINAFLATDYSDPGFDDSAWSVGTAPFGEWEDGSDTGLDAPVVYNASFVRTFATAWTVTTRLWLRRTFNIDRMPPQGFQLTFFIEDNCTVFVNGVEIISTPVGVPSGAGYTEFVSKDYFLMGSNSIVVRANDETNPAGVSVTYFDMLLEPL